MKFAKVTQHASLWQGMKQVLCTSQINIIPFITHPGHEKLYHTTGVFTNSSVGSFTSQKDQKNERAVRRGLGFFVLSDKTKKIIL